MTTNYQSMGKEIQRRREKADLTQDQLSDLAGLAYSTMSKIERGVIKNPSVFTISSLANALGCTIEDLLKHPSQSDLAIHKDSADTFLFCDLNGVLVRFFQRAFVKIAHKYELTPDNVETAFWHFNDAANRGDLSVDEFNKIMDKNLGVEGINWHEDYLSSIESIQQMHECVRKVAETNQVGILSNIHQGLIPKMIKQGLIPDIDYACIVDSSEVGAIKPEAKIYQIAEQMAGVSGDQILFVDDSRTNLMAAQRFGWRVMWFDDFRPKDSVARVKEALNL